MKQNKSRYAILGVLNIAPATGYDIKKYYDTVISGIWNENYGAIYPTLKTMQKEGCIKKICDETETRKNRYEITSQGRAELMKWMQEETPAQPVRSEFMLKFLFSSTLPVETIITMLNQYLNWHEMELDKYRKFEENLSKGISEITDERARFLRATFRRGILAAEASVAWCKETIQEFLKDT
ncbi:MAG: PadR family transcriptional regulator [Bacillota bacterium]|nr:PadR family transcriptional regulator [Bacillota bacterium]